MKLIHASLDTAHFRFDVYTAEGKEEAERLMRGAWNAHNQQCRQAGGYCSPFEDFADGVAYNEVELEQAYRDGEPIYPPKRKGKGNK